MEFRLKTLRLKLIAEIRQKRSGGIVHPKRIALSAGVSKYRLRI